MRTYPCHLLPAIWSLLCSQMSFFCLTSSVTSPTAMHTLQAHLPADHPCSCACLMPVLGVVPHRTRIALRLRKGSS